MPAWADGKYEANVSTGILPGEVHVGLTIGNGDFSVNVSGSDMVNSSTITDIRAQTNDEEKKTYTLEAVVNVGESSGGEETAPADEKMYSSFVMQLTDSGIDVKITAEEGILSILKDVIHFTEKTSGTTK